MSDECTHDCSTCSENCSSKQENPADMLEKPNELSNIKKVIGVVSGKGGVGKTLVTTMLAVESKRRGYNTAVLDADVTGPSVPRVFGLTGQASGSENGIFPVTTKTGLEVMSANLLLEDVTAPVIWRGPMIANLVKQFWTDVIWHKIDFMFVDMPPGTGDVPLTVFQSIPVDGIIIVTSPQELVSMIVTKAVRMTEMMHIPVLGLVENMSYIKCPDCGKIIKPFGESHADEITAAHGFNVLGRIPIDNELSKLCDSGLLELFENDYLGKAFDSIEEALLK